VDIRAEKRKEGIADPYRSGDHRSTRLVLCRKERKVEKGMAEGSLRAKKETIRILSRSGAGAEDHESPSGEKTPQSFKPRPCEPSPEMYTLSDLGDTRTKGSSGEKRPGLLQLLRRSSEARKEL